MVRENKRNWEVHQISNMYKCIALKSYMLLYSK